MKRYSILSIFAITFFTFLSTTAQNRSTNEGSFLIEANTGSQVLGTTGFYASSQDGNFAYNLGLDGGLFVIDDLAIKAGLGYGGGDDIANVLSYRLGLKYYYRSVIPVGIDITGASFDDSTPNPLWLGVQAGYAFFLTDHIAIEPGLRYNHSLNKDFSDKGLFQLNVGFALFF